MSHKGCWLLYYNILFFYVLQENYKSKYPQADVQIKFYNTKERALLALQGPKSAEILQSLVKNEDLYSLYFMESVRCNIAGVDARLV